MGESRGGFATAERISYPFHFLLKVYSISVNTFVEGIRQPIYAVIVGVAAVLILLSPYLTMYTLNASPKFMTDMGLATVLLAGLLLGAFTASNVISQEIENRTVLTVISKPVGRAEFILGKFLGVMGGLVLASYFLSLVLVLTISGGAMEADIEQELSLWVILPVLGSMFLAVCYGVYSNYFHDRPFASRAIGAATLLLTVCFFILAFVDTRAVNKSAWGGFGSGINIQVVFACIMCTWAILVLAAFAVAISTRLSAVANIALCSGLFLLGLLSEYIFKTKGEAVPVLAPVAKFLYHVVPNLQSFWVSDQLTAEVALPPILVIVTGLYAFFLIAAFLFLGMWLFQERQVA